MVGANPQISVVSASVWAAPSPGGAHLRRSVLVNRLWRTATGVLTGPPSYFIGLLFVPNLTVASRFTSYLRLLDWIYHASVRLATDVCRTSRVDRLLCNAGEPPLDLGPPLRFANRLRFFRSRSGWLMSKVVKPFGAKILLREFPTLDPVAAFVLS